MLAGAVCAFPSSGAKPPLSLNPSDGPGYTYGVRWNQRQQAFCVFNVTGGDDASVYPIPCAFRDLQQGEPLLMCLLGNTMHGVTTHLPFMVCGHTGHHLGLSFNKTHGAVYVVYVAYVMC